MDRITELKGQLKSRDPLVRLEAAKTLGASGFSQAVRPLMEALQKDESPTVRKQAALGLGNLTDARSFSALADALQDPDPMVRKAAVTAVYLSGDIRSPRKVAETLADEDRRVRTEAAKALSRMGDRAMEPLIQFLEHENPTVRWNAAILLGRTRDARPLDPLVKALDDEDLNVRHAVIRALGDLRDPRAYDPLLQVLNYGDEDSRWVAAETLGETGDSRAVDSLIAALESPDSRTVHSAALALGKLMDPSSVKPLCMAAIKKDSASGEAFIEALKSMAKQCALFLLEYMGKNNGENRERAALLLDLMGESLGLKVLDFFNGMDGAVEKLMATGDPRVSIPIMSALREGDASSRQMAVELLGKSKSRDAAGLLMKALDDESPRVRLQAVGAIAEWEGEEAAEKLLQMLAGESDEEVKEKITGVIRGWGDTRRIENLIRAWKEADSPGLKQELLQAVEALAQKTASLADTYRSYFCPRCLRRFGEFSVKISLFKKIRYYGCRSCRATDGVDGVKTVDAVLDRHASHFIVVEDDVLKVDWFRKKRPMDFDRVRLVEASMADVEEFIKIMEEDKTTLKRHGKMELVIDREFHPDKKMLKILKKTFRIKG